MGTTTHWNASPSPHAGFQRIDERLQGRRHLASAGVVEEKTHRARRPVFKQGDQLFCCYMLFDKSGGDTGNSDAVESSADRQIAMARDQRSGHGHFQTLAALLESPSVHHPAGIAVTHTIVAAEIFWGLRLGVSGQIVG